ncbi:ABC transporter ATP-binding protein [Cetobacterium sp.]|uniref:ABC transporter ATP-binding protein n=1 Tax=Cetobacterium sp. TaxID=2071632 RepID=UPI003AF0DFE4
MNEIPILELKNIFKSYNGQDLALKNINLKVKKGEIVAIIGQSGSGKSTLLNIIGALDTPTKGDIYFSGETISHYSSKERAVFRNKNIGFIFQFHFLLSQFNVLDNILIPNWIESGRYSYEKKDEALKILEYMDLKEIAYRNSQNISGGQQQRVAIARALLNKPQIVLADEPTGNLDSKTSQQIYNLLREINKKYNTTFLIVTHNPDIALMCDRVIEISDGEIKKEN